MLGGLGLSSFKKATHRGSANTEASGEAEVRAEAGDLGAEEA